CDLLPGRIRVSSIRCNIRGDDEPETEKTGDTVARKAAHSVTAAIVDRAIAILREGIPSSAHEVARQCLLDWFGCAVAGRNESLARILLAQAIEDGGNPVASVIGHPCRLSARQAALLNG